MSERGECREGKKGLVVDVVQKKHLSRGFSLVLEKYGDLKPVDLPFGKDVAVRRSIFHQR